MGYDYEIYAPLDTNLPDALAEIESKFLSMTSLQMKLEDCDLDTGRTQFGFGGNYDWIHNNITIGLGREDAIIASLASAPTDVVDTEKGKIHQNTLSSCFMKPRYG